VTEWHTCIWCVNILFSLYLDHRLDGIARNAWCVDRRGDRHSKFHTQTTATSGMHDPQSSLCGCLEFASDKGFSESVFAINSVMNIRGYESRNPAWRFHFKPWTPTL
jgi:hypothetical protein